MTAPRIVGANERELRWFSSLELGNDIRSDRAQNNSSFGGDDTQFIYDFLHAGPKRWKQVCVGLQLASAGTPHATKGDEDRAEFHRLA
jgi:hypothetical protein